MSLLTRFPPELWCAVWELMPFQDRVAVSHVCRYWRDISIHCPSLWQHLEFSSTIHGDDCICKLCGTWDESHSGDEDGDEVHTRVWVPNAGPPPGTTNMYLVLHVLSRACELPLYLTVEVHPHLAELFVVEDFGMQLVAIGAAERIVSISAVFDDPSTLRWLFSGMKRLPALKEITARRSTYPSTLSARADTQPWYDRNIDMPALSTIALFGVGWMGAYGERAENTFPSLSSVTCAFFYPEEVEILLNACPALDELRVIVGEPTGLGDYSWRLEPDVLSKLERVPSVRVEGVTSDSEAWAIDNFGGGLRASFAIAYADGVLPDLGLAFDLADIEYFGLTLNGLTLRSSRSLQRSLHFSSRHFERISSRLVDVFTRHCAASLKTLLLPGALIPTFIRPAQNALASLEALLIHDSDLTGLSLSPPLSSALPSLKVVHLMDGCGERPRIPADVLAGALDCLRCTDSDSSDRLEKLILGDVELDGDVGILRSRVETVC
ncbi:hypothetical protein EXIGLDRAFT_263501 [Exidia glandulosa HHB12029]|uniref:F-box domain-containing protein n=1 Tax=Exidia glandulosa HHB12029 TaxID=1314781 RepID=A0A165DQQ7_EXIGL|nr:hypothetical protein EXIGLDRAFT_263501 [Exidia glandulosa HHB12029]